ncbi:MAG: aminotransferase class I/II-fold pyridoxal phosphate-dependent enzyme [Clostridia bacterium]|nr:aminotransferase class I/II-fold pyridoxal phosphate-dependent enzyme [Clostridia bacterium]
MLYKTVNPHGGDIYNDKIFLDFSSNTNPLGTPVSVTDAVKESLKHLHCYPDPYCRKLVHDISKSEGIEEDYILCGNGAAELIYSYCDAVKPKLAVELAPTFSEYSAALIRVGCKVERYMLNQNTEFKIDENFLDYIKDKKPDVIFLCNPNNPTGRLISHSLLEKILSVCKELGIRLFIDECFLDLTDNRTSMKIYISQNPSLFILKAFTKSYGMAGIRLGYCLCSDTGLLMEMSKNVHPWNVSVIAQAAGVAAVREQNFVKKSVNIICKERKWLKEKLESLGIYVCPSEANYILIYGPLGLDIKLKKHGIAIRNCDNFYGLTKGWYRMAIRLHKENEMLIAAVKSVCEKR